MTAPRGEGSEGRAVKVYGLLLLVGSQSRRVIVAASSIKRAARALGVSPYYLREYGGQTWNAAECEAARARPGVPLVGLLDDYSGPYAPLPRTEVVCACGAPEIIEPFGMCGSCCDLQSEGHARRGSR